MRNDGLIEEAAEVMEEPTEGVMRDAAIISAAQKAAHYEIACYGTLRSLALTLGLNEAVDLLEQTLSNEKEADIRLTSVAASAVNIGAADER